MVKRILKKIIFRLISGLGLQPILGVPKHPILSILDDEYGHKNSVVLGKPVDKDNNPLPWFTYSAISFLSALDLSKLDVLEWGSGNSSLYFSERVNSITSIESDSKWYEHVANNKRDNQIIFLVGLDEYALFPKSLNKKFDIIIIDGRKRYECAKAVHEYLKEDGFIIFDNSDWYRNSTSLLRNRDFIQVDCAGFGPINMYTWTTSFFFTRSNKLTPLNNIQPVVSLGGLEETRD